MKGVLLSYSPWKSHMGFVLGNNGTEYAFFQELERDNQLLCNIERLAILSFKLEKSPGTLNGCPYIKDIKIVGYRNTLLPRNENVKEGKK